MILVECYSDELLIKSMGFSRKTIKHESGKGNVLRKLKIGRGTIGIIDEDPDSNQPKEMSRYTERESSDTIKLLAKNDNPEKKIIQISPCLEHWLIRRAGQNQISLKKYGLPDDPEEMHGITHIERNKNFQSFLHELIDKDTEIRTMQSWIKETIG